MSQTPDDASAQMLFTGDINVPRLVASKLDQRVLTAMAGVCRRFRRAADDVRKVRADPKLNFAPVMASRAASSAEFSKVETSVDALREAKLDLNAEKRNRVPNADYKRLKAGIDYALIRNSRDLNELINATHTPTEEVRMSVKYVEANRAIFAAGQARLKTLLDLQKWMADGEAIFRRYVGIIASYGVAARKALEK